ncbi:MAG: hypothetical protein ACREDR_41610 [Blastocatellia bacterium]
MKFMIEPLELGKEITQLVDSDLLNAVACGSGGGCSNGSAMDQTAALE